jgi:ABC-type proline/glycine betaine transport system permease subunit
MKDFFLAGGYGMYAISLFGFVLVAASVLYALRPGPRYQRLTVVLGITTFMTGLLSTSAGIGLSARYIHQVAPERQLGILALGVDESLHNIMLALIFVVLASLVVAVGAFREGKAAAA